jgi:hypothetical protein
MTKAAMSKHRETEDANEEKATPHEGVRELLSQGVEMVSAIHQQNDHTREWVRKAKAILHQE